MDNSRAAEMHRLLDRMAGHGLDNYSDTEWKAISWLILNGYAGNVGVSPAECSEMAASVGVQRASLQRVLRDLALRGIVRKLRVGTQAHYAINPEWSP
jgi:hypothetical protein